MNNFALVPRPPGEIEKAEPGAKRVLSGMVAETLELARKETPRKANPLRIVLVDDEPFVNEAIEMILRHWFHDVIILSFGDAASALKELSERKPDLLITDDPMPGMRGVELCRVLLDRKATYPMVVTTGYEEATKPRVDELAARHSNVFYLARPFGIEDLRRTIEGAGLKPPQRNLWK